MDEFRGSENYPREDYYTVIVSFGDGDSDGADKNALTTVALTIMFADETGTLVQISSPDSDSIAVRSSDDG